jgi:aminotransferase EvaB
MVFAERRDELLAFCKEQGIQAKVHYPVPVYLQPAVVELCGHKHGDFPVADRHGVSMISFPAHEHLTDEQVHYIVDTVKRFYQE